MNDKKVFDILDKFEFFQGQRAGRELWFDKPKEVQDKDIADFVSGINHIRDYLKNSVVLTREELKRLETNYKIGLGKSQSWSKSLKTRIEELEKENFKLSVERDVLKEEKEQLESDLCNAEMNLHHIAQELKQSSKETAGKFANFIKSKLFDLGNIVNERDIDDMLEGFNNENQ